MRTKTELKKLIATDIASLIAGILAMATLVLFMFNTVDTLYLTIEAGLMFVGLAGVIFLIKGIADRKNELKRISDDTANDKVA